MSRPTALYRWWDLADDLLYVGISTDLLARTSQHDSTDPWWPQIHTCTVEWYDDPREAQAAELKAIAEENPRYNRRIPRRRATVEHSGSNRRRLELLFCDALLEQRTGKTFAEWVAERRPQTSWRKITEELGSATGIPVEDGPPPYTVQRWYEKPLTDEERWPSRFKPRSLPAGRGETAALTPTVGGDRQEEEQ